MAEDFDGVCRWLDAHVGRRVFATTHPTAGEAGNTRLSVQGTLAREDGEVEITLIDARPGRIEVFRIGEATLVLLEGDFVSAAAGPLGEGLPEMVQATFQGVEVVVGALPAAV